MASSIKITKQCDVLVVGKTGAGKSTVANHILNKNWFRVSASVKSVTTEPSFKETLHTTPEGLEYNVRVIDTPGFFDTKRNNSAILEKLKCYFREKFSNGVNLVLFVFKRNRFTHEEQQTFDYIMKNFKGDISEISALIITNCENWNDSDRKDYIRKFKVHPDTADIADFMKKGIYCVGFPDLSKTKPALQPAFRDGMIEDGKAIRNQVYCCGERRVLFNEAFWVRWTQSCPIL